MGFNLCKYDDIQVIVDGDDQFIGQYVFQLINTQYQENSDIWQMNHIYKTNFYQ